MNSKKNINFNAKYAKERKGCYFNIFFLCETLRPLRLIYLFFILFFSVNVLVFARGRKDDAEIQTQKDEWILTITNFDSSSLPEERRNITGIIMRKLVENIDSINYRTRISPEYAYYEEAVWASKRSTAAKALASKQNERDLLLYKGDPDWMYRNNLKKIDEDIEKLRLELEEIDSTAPLINEEPVFKLNSENLNFRFPEPPVSGNEYRFCTSQNADGILIGSISEYHGRFVLNIKLYTLYNRLFVWEERIIFSHDDLDSIIEEYSRKLILVLSGNRPSAVAVNAQPEETLVLINRSFAGRGDTGVLEFPPGEITVTASAPDYESMTFTTELSPGELSQISINLKPIDYTDLEIAGNQRGLSGNVYHGAIYLGEAPLTLRLPANHLEYLELEIESGDSGKVVFYTPSESDGFNSINIRTRKPPKEGSVDRARRLFYWSWAGTWVSGIASWLGYYSYNNAANAYTSGGSKDVKLYNDAQGLYNFYTNSLIALGCFAVLDVILIARYIYVSNKDSTSVKAVR